MFHGCIYSSLPLYEMWGAAAFVQYVSISYSCHVPETTSCMFTVLVTHGFILKVWFNASWSLLFVGYFGSKKGGAAWLSGTSSAITCSMNSAPREMRPVWTRLPLSVGNLTSSSQHHTACPGGCPQNKTPKCGKQARASAYSNCDLCMSDSTLPDWCWEAEGELQPPSVHIPSVILTLIRSSLFVSTYIWDLQSEKGVADLTVRTLIKVIRMRHPV